MEKKYKRIIRFAIIGLPIICLIVWKLFAPSHDNDDQPLPSDDTPVSFADAANPFIKRIEREIDSLTRLPASVSGNVLYHLIQYHIDDGRLNNSFGSGHENMEWSHVLSEKLFFAYTARFIREAFYVFDSSEWLPSQLDSIDSETLALMQSPYLGKGSMASDQLAEIQDVIKKHNLIQQFINEANRYYRSGSYNLNTSQSYLAAARKHLNNGLGNKYLNNCRRLHAGLNDLPAKAFAMHQRHVVQTINANLDKYRTDTFSGTAWAQKAADYRNKIHEPVMAEIKLFEAENEKTYRITGNDAAFEALKTNWENELDKAIDYFKNQ